MAQGTGIPDRALRLRARFGPGKHADALATLHFALFRGNPASTGVEPTSTGGYARAAMLNDATLWGTIGASQVSVNNLVAVEFPVATGAYSITDPLDHWAVFDAASAGVLWYWGGLSSLITVDVAGKQPRLPIGSLLLTEPES